MPSKLKDNVNSSYFEAANKLRSKQARKRIVAYVESYDDIYFWRTVLRRFEDETRYFEIMLPSHQKLERGKKSVLMNLTGEALGHDMIACVDADYDYLLQGVTPQSKMVLENPYVFHTYAYAIENLQCYAPSLRTVMVAITLNDHQIFDFLEFMTRFSEAIFPLFVWSIWYYRRPNYQEFTITDFNTIAQLGGFSLERPFDCFKHLKHKVWVKIQELQRRNPDAKESYLALKAELQELGVTPQTTYLYIQGHHLFEKVVCQVMTKVSRELVRERELEIRRQSVHTTQMRNELSCYSHSTQDIAQMLKKNMGYVVSEPFRRIRQDIERLLSQQ